MWKTLCKTRRRASRSLPPRPVALLAGRSDNALKRLEIRTRRGHLRNVGLRCLWVVVFPQFVCDPPITLYSDEGT